MVDAAEFLSTAYQLVRNQQFWAPVAAAVSIGAIAGFSVGRFLSRSATRLDALPAAGPSPHELMLRRQLDEARTREANQNKLNDAVLSGESELWQLFEPQPPAGYSSPASVSRPKILVIANNKGGVGKTTLTAGLATYFERRMQKRVLLIDLDYQGSLTNWMIKAAGVSVPPDQSYRLAYANGLVDGGARTLWAAEALGNDKIAEGFVQARLISADYTLTKHETKLLLDWLLQGGTPDIRFYLTEALLSRHVQHPDKGFDVVLIDAPPRLTVGTVGALIAATHLLVPTIFDPLSAETVGSFLKQAWTLRTRFNQGLELAGVVGTKTTTRPIGKPLTAAELDARGLALNGMQEWKAEKHMFSADIQDIAAIRKRAGLLNPYFSEDDKVQRMFDLVGDELCQRMGISSVEGDAQSRPALKTGTRR